MAALSDSSFPHVVELTRLFASDLEPLLAEEIGVWEQRFSWDFRPSADLLRRFAQLQSLNGYALQSNRGLLGYAYHVCEDHKGLIGDFYVRDGAAGNDMLLLGSVVQGLMTTPGVRRIESQLMLLRTPTVKPLPHSAFLIRHDRDFMQIASDRASLLIPTKPAVRVKFVPWADRHLDDVAHLISAAYRGHVDSEINDQYRTIPGARRFLTNIIRFPGCGKFSAAGSIVAVDDTTGRVCGVCLASIVSPTSGHVTQICVLPGLRGASIGYELLRQCLLRLIQLGCNTMSLTVTCSNVNAIRLYESAGFRKTATFPALVWEGF